MDWTPERRASRPVQEYLVALESENPPTNPKQKSKANSPKRSGGTFPREDFTYDKDRNVYICPEGKALKTTGRLYEGKTFRYRASKFDCERCPLKMRCCPKTPARYVPRDINEEARDYTRELMKSDAYAASSVIARRSRGFSAKPNMFSRWCA